MAMMMHDACAPEETVLHLSPLVPPEPAENVGTDGRTEPAENGTNVGTDGTFSAIRNSADERGDRRDVFSDTKFLENVPSVPVSPSGRPLGSWPDTAVPGNVGLGWHALSEPY